MEFNRHNVVKDDDFCKYHCPDRFDSECWTNCQYEEKDIQDWELEPDENDEDYLD